MLECDRVTSRLSSLFLLNALMMQPLLALLQAVSASNTDSRLRLGEMMLNQLKILT
ncbi:hypothetical protein H6F70_03845 [Coleofasciculus sp. FACHB-T130]|uniref:hypothetical protein n=1 Tax=Trichocoleus sp. DQ-A2 TaxID=2933924 RepID=UPI00199D6459|nr:hypothetical protein [Coleofasciculus sp. FACHB-T130]